MLLNQELFNIFLKNLQFSQPQRDLFSLQYGTDLNDLIWGFTINKMSEEMSKDELANFEKLMHKVATHPTLKIQKQILAEISEFIKTSKTLGPELTQYISRIDRKLFYSLMEASDEEGKTRALEHIHSQLQKAK